MSTRLVMLETPTCNRVKVEEYALPVRESSCCPQPPLDFDIYAVLRHLSAKFQIENEEGRISHFSFRLIFIPRRGAGKGEGEGETCLQTLIPYLQSYW
jgi:hypothetical protein